MHQKRTVYLDYAAATPLDERVFVAMKLYFSEQFYNPSSPYMAARAIKTALKEAKQRIGKVIGGRDNEIIITAGATESINLAIRGVMGQHPEAKVLTSAIEHPSVLDTAKAFGHTVLPVTNTGLVDVNELKHAITDDLALVSIGYANNEIGTVQALRDIARVIEEVKMDRRKRGVSTPLYFHTDASQAPGHLDIHVSRLGVDLLTLNAGKCYGPKQVGLLWVKSGIQLSPLLTGGGQEQGLRSGTENVAGTIGFAEALERSDAERHTEADRQRALRDKLQQLIVEALPDTVVSGHQKRRLPNVLHVAWEGVDGERVLFRLDETGVMVATGSACAANKGTRSHVLNAIGLKPSVADGSIRMSLGRQITEEDIQYTAEQIIAAVKKERGR